MLREPSGPPVITRLLAAGAVTICIAAMVPVRVTARHAAAEPTFSHAASPAVEFRQPRERKLAFVMFVDDHKTNTAGSFRDIERARTYRRAGERLLWFRHEGREYVVRDSAVLDEVVAIWGPVNEIGGELGRLGGEQGELGAKQGELGAKQGEIGAEQGRLGARQGELGARQGMLAAQEAAIGENAARRAAFERERAQIEHDMLALDREMRLLDVKIEEFNKPMRDLGDQMEVLGEEMQVLGRKMEEASRKADADMLALLERVVSTGAAEAVK